MQHPLDEKFETPLTPDAFAEKYGYPPAMIRLAIDCGLSSPKGKVTGVAFCRWLTAHYNVFRKAAGLPELATPIKSMSAKERAHITIGNVLRTHADYFASRTSSLEYREAWMNLSNDMASGFESSNIWLTPRRHWRNL